jgi:dTDP-L-rhamnose 4-epimerase
VTGSYRQGDIRHNVADLTKIRQALNFEPRWGFEDGVREFLSWAEKQPIAVSQYDRSLDELREKGLLIKSGEQDNL